MEGPARRISLLLIGGLFAVAPQNARAQTVTPAAATAAYFDAVRDQPGLLIAMLRAMPKGGDLHSHLSGAIYAESFIAWGAQNGSCVQADMMSVAPPCDSTAGRIPVAAALHDDVLYGRIIDAWSMRNWSPALESGHDHFFATFGKYSVATRGRTGDMIAEAAQRAADDRVSYLELMNTPSDGAIGLGSRVGWDDDFTRMRDKLRAAGLADAVTAARANFAAALTRAHQLLACESAAPQPGCAVQIRFLYQVLRGLAPEQVFAQILTAFETASVDSSVVGFNLVMPEDGLVSMRDFDLHMRIIDYLHGLYPSVRISLHAGELAPGLVPPEGLRFHIRESVEKGHASRIGHGVDIMHEDDAIGLLRELAARGVAVEICLTSNEVILGVAGKNHPLAQYRAFGVPVLLATDDQGVARSDMNLEYARAVQQQGLRYTELKTMARNSIQYAFVQDSVKKQLLAKLDRDFVAFEAKWSSYQKDKR